MHVEIRSAESSMDKRSLFYLSMAGMCMVVNVITICWDHGNTWKTGIASGDLVLAMIFARLQTLTLFRDS